MQAAPDPVCGAGKNQFRIIPRPLLPIAHHMPPGRSSHPHRVPDAARLRNILIHTCKEKGQMLPLRVSAATVHASATLRSPRYPATESKVRMTGLPAAQSA